VKLSDDIRAMQRSQALLDPQFYAPRRAAKIDFLHAQKVAFSLIGHVQSPWRKAEPVRHGPPLARRQQGAPLTAALPAQTRDLSCHRSRPLQRAGADWAPNCAGTQRGQARRDSDNACGGSGTRRRSAHEFSDAQAHLGHGERRAAPDTAGVHFRLSLAAEPGMTSYRVASSLQGQPGASARSTPPR